MKNREHFLYVIAVILLVVFVSSFFYQTSFAFVGFGGPIISVLGCTNGLLLTIGPPSGGFFLLPFWTTIYPFFSIKPGSWTLGTYIPGGACSFGPVVIPVQGTILMTGTSQ